MGFEQKRSIHSPSDLPAATTPRPLLADVGQLIRFSTIALQLTLLVLVIQAFQIEPSSGLLKATWLILIGFVIHALLPQRYRLRFYLALSLAVFMVVLGTPGMLVIGVGLALVATCHLPVPFRFRIALLAFMAVALIALRANIIHFGPKDLYAKPLPVLGSLFLFRLVIYLYDLRHEREPVSVWTRLSYFFLFPNAFFLLFPVIDYQTFRRTYYQRDALDIYQKGVHWIFRGLTQILLYRVVYYYLSPSPSAVHGIGDVVMFVASAWLLFIHVSGTFHLAVGILCLFGFDLPETNRLYFLASSPNEIWRRANIYWKDFMMKVFYYPIYKSLQKRRLALIPSLVAATLGVFVATWVLHSYQWFWIRGKFPFAGIDAAFWTIFAALVVGNTLWELKHAKKRSIRQVIEWSPGESVIHAAKVVGMFALMSVMWSWWSTRDTGEWISIISSGLRGGPITFVALAFGVVGIVAAGALVQYFRSLLGTRGWQKTQTSQYSAYAIAAGALIMLGLSSRRTQDQLGERSGSFIASLQSERLNARDTELQNRSYYESLMEGDQPTSMLAQTQVEAPENDNQKIKESGATRKTDNALGYELIPSHRSVINSVVQTTNRWGMRDKDYDLHKPANTRRIALIGGSVIMGSGVQQADVFESRLEKQLTEAYPSRRHRHYEILNFAVAGYGMIQYVFVTERNVFRFDPDILMLATLSGESARSAAELTDLLAKGIDLPSYAKNVVRIAGIKKGMRRAEIRRKLANDLVGERLEVAGYREIVAECRKHAVLPVWVYLPSIKADITGYQRKREEEMMRLARDAGFFVLDLSDAYAGHTESELMLAPWDPHPNALGHQLIAESLYRALRANDKALGLGLTGADR